MKILHITPKKFLSATKNEKSRLGNQVQAINITLLKKQPHGIVFFGIPSDQGIRNVGGRLGAAKAPDTIRSKLYHFTSKKFSFPIYDFGNLIIPSSIEETHAGAAEAISLIRRAGHLPIILGGGHDLAYPEALSLLQNEKNPCGFLNIDAHLDLRNTEHGITSGSPWYLLLQNPLFKKQKCSLIEFGIQSHCNVDTLFEYAKNKKVEIHSLDKVISSPVQSFQKTLSKLTNKKKSILVSLDIDSARSSDAPGCSAPQVRGFSAENIIQMSKLAGKHGKVRSFGIYEVSPPLDQDNRSSTLAAHCILQFLEGFEMRK